MLKRSVAVLVALSLAPGAEARPRPPAAMQKSVTRDFVDADLSEVVKLLCEAMGRKVYLGPGIERKLTVSLRSVPPLAALHELLANFDPEVDYKLIGKETIVVATPDCLATLEDRPCLRPRPKGAIRQEILLKRAPAAKVIGILQAQYKDVEFIPHPTMNGFYAVGLRPDILRIKTEVPWLDVEPERPDQQVVREFLQIRYGDLDEVRSLLQTLVPDVTLNTDSGQSTLIIEGTPAVVEQAKELLDQLDKPLDQIVMECKLLRVTEAGDRNLAIDWQGTPLGSSATVRVGTFKRNQPVVLTSTPTAIASPRVGMQSGQESAIHIGDKFPIVRYDPTAGEFRYDYQDVGLRLETTATVEENGPKIHCKLHGEFTYIEEMLANRYPRTQTVTFDGELGMKDGETTVLEGLLTPKQAREAVSQAPLLADLPILGKLFRDIQDEDRVYLMLTPNLMK